MGACFLCLVLLLHVVLGSLAGGSVQIPKSFRDDFREVNLFQAPEPAPQETPDPAPQQVPQEEPAPQAPQEEPLPQQVPQVGPVPTPQQEPVEVIEGEWGEGDQGEGDEDGQDDFEAETYEYYLDCDSTYETFPCPEYVTQECCSEGAICGDNLNDCDLGRCCNVTNYSDKEKYCYDDGYITCSDKAGNGCCPPHLPLCGDDTNHCPFGYCCSADVYEEAQCPEHYADCSETSAGLCCPDDYYCCNLQGDVLTPEDEHPECCPENVTESCLNGYLRLQTNSFRKVMGNYERCIAYGTVENARDDCEYLGDYFYYNKCDDKGAVLCQILVEGQREDARFNYCIPNECGGDTHLNAITGPVVREFCKSRNMTEDCNYEISCPSPPVGFQGPIGFSEICWTDYNYLYLDKDDTRFARAQVTFNRETEDCGIDDAGRFVSLGNCDDGLREYKASCSEASKASKVCSIRVTGKRAIEPDSVDMTFYKCVPLTCHNKGDLNVLKQYYQYFCNGCYESKAYVECGEGVNAELIIGAVFGTIGGLCICCVAVYIVKKQKRGRAELPPEDEGPQIHTPVSEMQEYERKHS